jgi:hypothetical protein
MSTRRKGWGTRKFARVGGATVHDRRTGATRKFARVGGATVHNRRGTYRPHLPPDPPIAD